MGNVDCLYLGKHRMWLERYLIIVPGLVNKQVFTFTWAGLRAQPGRDHHSRGDLCLGVYA